MANDGGDRNTTECRSCRPGMAAGDAFRAVEHASPCDPVRWPADDVAPPSCGSRRWSLASAFRARAVGFGTNGPRMSVAYSYYRASRTVCASAAAELWTGEWTAGAGYRSEDGRLRAFAAGRARSWHRAPDVRLDVRCNLFGRTVALSADPTLKKCSVRCLQNVLADGRLSVGYEMEVKKDRADYCGNGRFSVATSVLANYAGPDYLVGGKVDPLARTAKVAYYRRVCGALQTAATIAVDAAVSTAVTRLAFRVRHGESVYRAAVGTDGVATGQWNKRFGRHAAFSWTAFVFLNAFRRNDYGIGLGLTFR